MEKVNAIQVNYEKNNILSKCDDVILEAKRVILNEQLDKIANITLSDVNNSRNVIDNCIKQCKDNLNWKNELFWQHLPPNPKKSPDDLILKDKNPKKAINSQPLDVIDDLLKINKKENIISKHEKKDNTLTEKYFLQWRVLVKLKKEKNKMLENRIEQKEKLDRFVKDIKKFNKQEKRAAKVEPPLKTLHYEKPSSPQIYKNRYNAQKNIINMQKAKLEQQNKLIDELKLGIIREDLLKSIENTKHNIREIFSNCSSATKCKVPIVIIKETQQFKIDTQKAPKVIQQMEQRALQREQKRQMILERKRLIEEAHQKMVQDIIEKKRVLEEEEKKRNLEIIKERRKKELEQEKIRQANKQKYLENLNRATTFHNNMLMVKYFKRLYNYFKENKENALLAKKHYEFKILKRSICCWCEFVEDTYKLKYEIADAQFAYYLLKKVFKYWKDTHIENVRNMQTAEDLYDFHLTSNTFIYWHRYVCFQIILQEKRLKIAENHHKRRLLFHYFYMWRSLPAVMQLEKAKELKKRKWREKVWQILPDYKPPEDL